MKYALHAFMTINPLIDNSRHRDSIVGELSLIGRTYASDVGQYTLEQYPDVRLLSFRSVTDETDEIPVPEEIKEICLKLGHRLENMSQTAVLTKDNVVNQQVIAAEFGDVIKSVKLGKVVASRGNYMPQFIEFKLNDTSVYEVAYIKVWFSDPAFRTQYSFHEIRVIPAIERLDDFFADAVTVSKLEEKVNLPEIIDKINTTKDRSPYTLLKSYHFDWTKEDERIPFPWTVVIYGGIGENMDLIKDAIANYILENSDHPREEWEKIFPDLFIPTEFVFIPAYGVPSIEAPRYVEAMCSPTLRIKDLIKFGVEGSGGYTEEHIREYGEVSSILYRSLGFVVAGNPLNRLAPVSFYEAFPQYALIGSRTDDFNRMDPDHQMMVRLLNTLFYTADILDVDTAMPEGVSRITRDGKVYVAGSYNRIQFLVIARINYTTGGLEGMTIGGHNLIDVNYKPVVASEEVIGG